MKDQRELKKRNGRVGRRAEGKGKERCGNERKKEAFVEEE